MTYIEFADKYLTPPERARFLRNYLDPLLNYDLLSDMPMRTTEHDDHYLDFLYDRFCRSDSPEGWTYWRSVIRRLRRENDD